MVFTSEELAVISSYETAYKAAANSADLALQSAYVDYIKMLNAKFSLHRGFIFLNRFLSYETEELTIDFFAEFQNLLNEYFNFVSLSQLDAAKIPRNRILVILDNQKFFLPMLRDKYFDATAFSVSENTDPVIIALNIPEIDNSGRPTLIDPSALTEQVVNNQSN